MIKFGGASYYVCDLPSIHTKEKFNHFYEVEGSLQELTEATICVLGVSITNAFNTLFT